LMFPECEIQVVDRAREISSRFAIPSKTFIINLR
jgi:hypothetical protein